MLPHSVWPPSSSGLPLRFALLSLARGAALFAVWVAFLPAAVAEERRDADFGKDIALAPFEVNGEALSISIHARSKSDRRYAEKFADEVVDIAYYTVGEFSGEGLVIVGSEGEPHPIHICRQFLALAKEGRLHPSTSDAVKEIDAMLTEAEKRMTPPKSDAKAIDISFETFIPALPLPLEGASSRLYQIAWAEGFDSKRLSAKFSSLTREDLEKSELSRFDWVFYLPPRSASGPVLKELLAKVMAKEKMGLFKRAAIRSALIVMKPTVTRAVEALRKGVLYLAILRAESPYSKEDIAALTQVYVGKIMPDLKPGSIDRAQILAAIDKQKEINAEHARNPFKAPERLVSYDPETYAACLGEYTRDGKTATHWFRRQGTGFTWAYKKQPPRPFFPAGERLFVNEKGNMTIEFLVDETGAVTGVEERWVRRRQTIPRKPPQKPARQPL